MDLIADRSADQAQRPWLDPTGYTGPGCVDRARRGNELLSRPTALSRTGEGLPRSPTRSTAHLPLPPFEPTRPPGVANFEQPDLRPLPSWSPRARLEVLRGAVEESRTGSPSVSRCPCRSSGHREQAANLSHRGRARALLPGRGRLDPGSRAARRGDRAGALCRASMSSIRAAAILTVTRSRTGLLRRSVRFSLPLGHVHSSSAGDNLALEPGAVTFIERLVHRVATRSAGPGGRGIRTRWAHVVRRPGEPALGGTAPSEDSFSGPDGLPLSGEEATESTRLETVRGSAQAWASTMTTAHHPPIVARGRRTWRPHDRTSTAHYAKARPRSSTRLRRTGGVLSPQPHVLRPLRLGNTDLD